MTQPPNFLLFTFIFPFTILKPFSLLCIIYNFVTNLSPLAFYVLSSLTFDLPEVEWVALSSANRRASPSCYRSCWTTGRPPSWCSSFSSCVGWPCPSWVGRTAPTSSSPHGAQSSPLPARMGCPPATLQPASPASFWPSWETVLYQVGLSSSWSKLM